VAKYHGKGLRVQVGISSTATASLLVGVTDWEIDLSVDTAETTAGGDSNKTYVQGLANGQFSMSGVWDDTETKLVAGAASTTGVKIYAYPDYAGAAGKYISGVFWLSVSFQNAVGDAAKWTATAVPNAAITNNL
jgi:uncharacterized protein YggU (UPF0235/DUF167 family)